ncbi:hypothetical protein ABIB57_005310 [Devosia sp. UYZn731]|uniref:hypothetical protein n=1 Tax=Devosia sp. UYZn731 TaxID=3156345 RepID=UPI0033981A38
MTMPAGNDGRRATSMPKWVKVSLWIGGVLIVLVVVMTALGHGPGQHMGLH